MTNSTPKSMYLSGILSGAPFILVVIPFSMLFGIVATEAGLPISQVMGFSVLVIAGAAQFTAVQMMTDNAPIAIILVTSLAVNLRMAMYSASITPHLGAATLWQRIWVSYLLVDQSYITSVARYEAQPDMSLSNKLRYFFGVITPVAPVWYAASYFGAVVGGRIPPEYAIDFGLPITFLAMIAPLLRTFAHLATALTSIVLALSFAWMPYGTGLLVAAFVAMGVGAELERRAERRRA